MDFLSFFLSFFLPILLFFPPFFLKLLLHTSFAPIFSFHFRFLMTSFSSSFSVSFQLYDFDCDGKISQSDLTAVVSATLRENDVVISRVNVEELVAATLLQAKSSTPGYLTFEEYFTAFFMSPFSFFLLPLSSVFIGNRYKASVGEKPLLLAPLTLNISSIIAEYTIHNGVTFATPRLASASRKTAAMPTTALEPI